MGLSTDVIIDNGDLENAEDVEATDIISSHRDDCFRKIEERGYTLGCVSDSLKGAITDELLHSDVVAIHIYACAVIC